MSAWAEAREAAQRLAAAGIEDERLEAELLARAAAGGITRAEYFAGRALSPGEAEWFSRAVERRLRGEPNAYISGRREFFGHSFAVGPGVLIPRPETEMLVEAGLEALRGLPPWSTVVDVGTGSGCIAVPVALGAPEARVVGVDPSACAIETAKGNARRLRARVTFVRGHLLGPVGGADVVLANLPYIPSGEIGALQPEVRDWEPRGALDGGEDGLALIMELIADCGSRVRPWLLALEVGRGQAAAVGKAATAAGASVTVTADFAGIERMVCARWG